MIEGVGPMQHGVGLVADSADAVEKLAAVVVKQVPGRGRCVFAGEPIRRGQLIEIAPCLRFPRAQYEALQLAQTPLEHYVFVERGTRDLLLALGIGSLFNHSESPNVDYRVAPPSIPAGSSEGERDLHADPQGRVTFRCARPVAVGEELCIYYGPDLWFQENQQVEASW
jgi:SET domain-containing protein